MPQREVVNWDFPVTVADVVMMGRTARLGWLRFPGAEDRRTVADALKQVGMPPFAGRQISQLSGGQQQRVFLARALAQGGRLLLLDEPLNGVDANTQETIGALLQRVRDEGGTVLMATHDLELAAELVRPADHGQPRDHRLRPARRGVAARRAAADLWRPGAGGAFGR